jgi:hypothetical protein
MMFDRISARTRIEPDLLSSYLLILTFTGPAGDEIETTLATGSEQECRQAEVRFWRRQQEQEGE